MTSKLNFETAGGSVADLHLKAKGLAELGHEVTVITAFSRVNKINQGLPYRVIEENILSHGLVGIQIGAYKIIKKLANQADAIYLDGQIFLYAGGLYRLLGGRVPIVAFFNVKIAGIYGLTVGYESLGLLGKLKRQARYRLEKNLGVLIANKSDVFIFNTPMLARIYFKFGLAEAKSVIIEDFVDMGAIVDRHKISQEKIENLQRQAKKIIIFTTGRMLVEKGFDLLIKAFSLVSNKEKYQVVMCGGGPDEKRLHGLVKELKLENYIAFPGWLTKHELENYFATSHIFVFPKWWLDYGSAVLTEAFAFGLPCIIPGGGALEWLSQGGALTFKPDDYQDLSNKIEQLGANAEVRISLAVNSFNRVTSLDYKVLAKKLEQTVKQAVK